MTRPRAPFAALVVLCALTVACTSTPSKVDDSTPGTGDVTATDPATTDDDPAITSSGTAPPNTDPATGDATAALEWGACDDPEATDSVLQCATVSVPLDYGDPATDRIDIALVRVPATEDRVGAVLVNPGGPGGSGFDYVALGGSRIVATLGLEQFDVIGFDPRGVDRSNGLRCVSNAEQDAVEFLDDTPDTPDEQAALDAAEQQFRSACIAKYGDTLRDYSTEATARDMDLIRAGLGDEQISLLGLSYGTYLFAAYATLFPERVRAMVLDSAYEPTGDTVEQQYTTQLVGFEHAFDNWSTWCESTDDCAFRSADVGSDWDALAVELDDSPVAATDGRPANETVMRVATISALYDESDWPVLADALAAVRTGDPSGLFALADSYVGRDSDGTYSTIEQAGHIIRCASGLDAELPDDPAALVATLQQLAPRFSAGITVDDFEDSCVPLVDDVAPLTLQYDGDAPVVVVSGTNDPATPFRWATKMQAAMGSNAALVSYTGEGHGVMDSSICGAQIESAVLVDLQLPEAGTTCAPDPVIEQPSWWRDLPVPEGVSSVFKAPGVTALLGFTPTLAYTELRTSALPAADVADAYEAALADAGFEVGDRAEPTPGVTQSVFRESGGDLLGMLVFGDEAMADPDLAALAELVPAGQTLIVLLTRPT